MIDNLKLLLGVGTLEEPMLNTLIEYCKNFAINYCNLVGYNKDLDFIVQQMVCEKYSQLGAEGVSSRSFSGVNEAFYSSFSDAVLSSLNRFRRIGVISDKPIS